MLTSILLLVQQLFDFWKIVPHEFAGILLMYTLDFVFEWNSSGWRCEIRVRGIIESSQFINKDQDYLMMKKSIFTYWTYKMNVSQHVFVRLKRYFLKSKHWNPTKVLTKYVLNKHVHIYTNICHLQKIAMNRSLPQS